MWPPMHAAMRQTQHIHNDAFGLGAEQARFTSYHAHS